MCGFIFNNYRVQIVRVIIIISNFNFPLASCYAIILFYYFHSFRCYGTEEIPLRTYGSITPMTLKIFDIELSSQQVTVQFHLAELNS